MGNNPETYGDICSQEYSGIIFLILKKKKKKPLWKEKGSQKLFWQTRKTLRIFKNVPGKNKNELCYFISMSSFEQF